RPAAEVGAGVLALAGNDAFWKFHGTVFRSQGTMETDQLLDFGAAAGASRSELAAGLQAKRWAAKIDRDTKLATRLGANGTPAFFINGTLLSGAQPYEKFTSVIDNELVAAKALVAHGTKRERVYAELATIRVADAANAKKQNHDDDDDDEKEDT